MKAASSPDELRRLIDEALEEIERTELEMLDLLSDVLGPDEAQLVADQIAAQGQAERFRRLLGSRDGPEGRVPTPEPGDDGSSRPAASPGSSRSRPATP